MDQVTRENHATAKRDDVASTVSEIMHEFPISSLNVHTAQGGKQRLTTILGELYDRAVAEGRYLEIMVPSQPDQPELPIVPVEEKKKPVRAKTSVSRPKDEREEDDAPASA